MSMGDDLFLYTRCAVVAAGRSTFSRVRADPTAIAGTWYAFDGEHLLTVAPTAYQRITKDEWDYDTTVSYETGSNN